MKTVCIESPLAGDFALNIAYARACLRYCLELGHSPYASHLLLPQVYNELSPREREVGIMAGLAMGNQCDERWHFEDLGVSSGMYRALSQAPSQQPTRCLKLGLEWATKYPSTPTPGF